ncbi:UPF0489 family protein [Pseudoalteromonas sp. TB64]|uniref:UPF0489 family protein n=1 Tax=Pseudoalteromonas sp. TB64 TaxID=1938600 RepID=UPI00040C12A3|nr:UPF0489 family protein [Pseudoalteromonas sp. TB64]
METGKWIIPFKGRNASGATKVNFLYQQENVFFMDNHRTASWCWEKNISECSNIALIHIDAHYDAGVVEAIDIMRLPDPKSSSVTEYINKVNRSSPEHLCETPVITWDTYLYIFESIHRDKINSLLCVTHGYGAKLPDESVAVDLNADKVTNSLYQLANFSGSVIINIDLDYFAKQNFKDDNPTRSLKKIAEAIGVLSTSASVCITICLSPGCCDGWEEAEAILKLFNRYAEFNFELPKS